MKDEFIIELKHCEDMLPSSVTRKFWHEGPQVTVESAGQSLCDEQHGVELKLRGAPSCYNHHELIGKPRVPPGL